jgi:hypothetical protein
MLMTLAFRGHRLCSSWQNGTGIVWVIEPYLALMIGGPRQFLPAYQPVISPEA